MSVTLLCLVKGSTLANAFPVHIDSNQLVGDLKEAIKAKKQNDFAGVDADRFKLWNVMIRRSRRSLKQSHTQGQGRTPCDKGNSGLLICEIA
jgi:hypothetical protein